MANRKWKMAKTPLFYHLPFSIQHQAGLFQHPV
jgi:hypothetical protein